MENTTENGVDLSDSTVISETAEFDQSAVMNSLEVHSTPNVGPVSYTHLFLCRLMKSVSPCAPGLGGTWYTPEVRGGANEELARTGLLT